jgi:hypothetical protein
MGDPGPTMTGASGGPSGRAAGFGLCASCVHARIFQSGKGAVYVSCERSRTDAGFPRFPSVPVLQCRGFEPFPEDPPVGPNDGDRVGPLAFIQDPG